MAVSHPAKTAQPSYRSQWDRVVIPALILLIMTPFVVYMAITVRSAREIRRNQSLERNLGTAQLAARLVDTQCEAALSALGVLAKRQVSAALDAGDKPSIQRDLSEAVDLVPDLVFAAVYQSDGTNIAHYPGSQDKDWSAIGKDWFRKASAASRPSVGTVYRQPDPKGAEVIGLAVPLGSRRKGYLVAYYRLRVVDAWLKPIHFGPGCVLYIVDADGRILAASNDERARLLNGYTPVRQALKKHSGMVRTMDLDGREPALVGYVPARVPGWAVLVVQPETAALASTDYLAYRLYGIAVPLLLFMGGIGWVLDYLYRRQAQLARQVTAASHDLAHQNELLRTAGEAKSDFLANVSHDLRTPLSIIQASVTGMLEPDVEWDRSSLHSSLTVVNEEIDRLTARVRNLLEMSRIEAGALPMRAEPCDLTDIVGSALERMDSALQGRKIKVTFPPDGLIVKADYAQIENVTINLLENAAKYSPAHTPLYLLGETCGDSAVLSLADEGPGVRPGDEERVFEKFYRADTNNSGAGTGLGLAICKAIIDRHRGAIGVRRAQRGGAEFWFSLPLLPPMWG